MRSDVQSRAHEAGLSPNRLRGQHFLVDARVRDRIIQEGITPFHPPYGKGERGGYIVEIGPGLGVLTDELVKRAKHVYAVDIDPQITNYLKKRYQNTKNITIENKDALNYKLQATSYKLVSNLPYEITTPFLWRYLLELEPDKRPQKLILLIQREVADRILIKKSPYNSLALLVQWFGRAERICNVSRHAFWPEPQVEGAVIVITPFHPPYIRGKEGVTLFRVIRAGFSHPRRQLATNLRAAGFAPAEIAAALANANLPALVRAETLDLASWQTFSKGLISKI